jgi:hypothetical protein
MNEIGINIFIPKYRINGFINLKNYLNFDQSNITNEKMKKTIKEIKILQNFIKIILKNNDIYEINFFDHFNIIISVDENKYHRPKLIFDFYSFEKIIKKNLILQKKNDINKIFIEDGIKSNINKNYWKESYIIDEFIKFKQNNNNFLFLEFSNNQDFSFFHNDSQINNTVLFNDYQNNNSTLFNKYLKFLKLFEKLDILKNKKNNDFNKFDDFLLKNESKIKFNLDLILKKLYLSYD